MRRSQFRLRPRRIFLALCACALLMTIWMGSFSERTSTAYAVDASELVQTGVDSYQIGDFTSAIDAWQSAIGVYETTQELSALAVVSENLARAYQQIGQTSEEVQYWNKAITATQSLTRFPYAGSSTH